MSDLPGGITVAEQIVATDVQLEKPTLAPKYTDEGAIKLVIGDLERAADYLENKQWNLHWRESDILMQSPRTFTTFEKSTVTRANVSRFTVAKHVNSLVPGMKDGIFYEKPPFLIRPRPSQKQDTIYAKSALYDSLLDDIDFEVECEHAMEQQVLFGTVICHGGWEVNEELEYSYTPADNPIQIDNVPLTNKPITVHTKESDAYEMVPTVVTKNRPFFEVCELGTVFPDPKWKKPNQIHKAKYVCHVTYLTLNDLNDLRANPLYDIPSADKLKKFFFEHDSDALTSGSIEESLGQSAIVHHGANENVITSDDPTERPLQCVARWTKGECKTILRNEAGRACIIRNGPHTMRRIPYFSANFWNLPRAGWGLGVGRLAGSDQRIEKGLIDAVLDLLSFIVNPQYARARGANVNASQIRQRLGGIIDVDVNANQSVRDAFGIVELPKVPPEAFAVVQNAQTNAQSTTGADEAFTQGNLPQRGGSSAARTATGAGGIIAANAGKIQGPVGHFCNGILIPYLKMLDEMVKQFMPLSEIRSILGDLMTPDYELDVRDFLSADHKFEVLAGAHLAAKKAMAQALPLMIQILENPHLVAQLNAMGYAVDVKQIFEMFMEMSGWKNTREVIRPMNPQEKQSFQQNNPGAAKLQQMLTQIGAKHQAKSEEIDQQAEAHLAHDMVLSAGDEATGYVERRLMRNQENASVFTQQ